LFEPKRQRIARHKATGAVAGELMSTPAVTAHPETGVVEAARRMDTAGVKRLPVVDELGRLVGIVSRRDLLKVFLRTDEEIRTEILQDLRTCVQGSDTVGFTVAVEQGRVTLSGEFANRSLVVLAVHVAERADGVVAVDDRLDYRLDDTDRGFSGLT
jgi:CBS-domain-containing membrane protein